MPVIDVMDIKHQNIREIVDAIRFEESGLTKKEITEKTHLSFATVSNLCNELIENNVLGIVKSDALSVGRTPGRISLQHTLYNIICLNLQMKNVMGLAVLNIKNEIIFNQNYNIEKLTNPQEVILFAREMFEKEFRPLADENAVYIGIGVAVSAIFDFESRELVNCSIDMYSRAALKDIVEDVFRLPTYVDNEANLCALSIQSRKADKKNIVYLHISEGVGVGIICSGNLVRGYHGYGGEVAHVPVGDMQKKCDECGQYGCIENELSVPAVVNTYFGNTEEYILNKWNQYVDDIGERKEKAIILAEKNAIYLGSLASILVNIFDPEILYIGGDISKVYPVMQEKFKETLNQRCRCIVEKGLQITCDSMSEESINVGISESIYHKWNIL